MKNSMFFVYLCFFGLNFIDNKMFFDNFMGDLLSCVV